MYESSDKFGIAKQRQKQKESSINPCEINFILSHHWEYILLFQKVNSLDTIMENYNRHSNRLIPVVLQGKQ